jgi:hypothetical protein
VGGRIRGSNLCQGTGVWAEIFRGYPQTLHEESSPRPATITPPRSRRIQQRTRGFSWLVGQTHELGYRSERGRKKHISNCNTAHNKLVSAPTDAKPNTCSMHVPRSMRAHDFTSLLTSDCSYSTGRSRFSMSDAATGCIDFKRTFQPQYSPEDSHIL